MFFWLFLDFVLSKLPKKSRDFVAQLRQTRQMKAPFGGGAPIQWRGEGADHFYPTMFDI